MFKVGLSSCSKRIDENLFKQYKDSGIEFMEVSLSKTECDETDLERLKKLSEKYGVALWSYHLPFMPFEEIDISSLDEEKRRKSVEYLSSLVLKATKVGIEIMVIHPSAEPISDENRAKVMAASKKSLKELCDVCEQNGAVLAVENLPRTCLGKNADEMAELVSCDERLRVCFDTNHLLGEDFERIFEKVGDKIVTVHISDYDFINERHWLPGEGKLDWKRMYDCFKKSGYNGPWLYEIVFYTPATIIRDRELNCDDFVRNAKELFGGKPFTIFSKQKENLGMWG